MLAKASETVARIEETETELATSKAMVARLPAQDMREQYAHTLRELQQRLIEQKQVMAEQLNKMISAVEKLKGLKS